MKRINLLLLALIAVSIFIHAYKLGQVPACLNADEAAFGYNAYSLLKTMRDEHGVFLPLRLLSFNDLKLPLYSYLSIPFIALFGLNIYATRVLSMIAGVLLVPIMYYLVLEFFRNRKAAYIAAFLTAISPWVYILSRHAHETVLSTVFIALSVLMLLRYKRSHAVRSMVGSLISILLATFSYHSARLFLFFVVGYFIIDVFKKSKGRLFTKYNFFVFCFIGIVFVIPVMVDYTYGTNRVNNLFFTQNDGFQLKLDEYLRENPNRLLHNKGTQFIKEATMRYFTQLSPDFLVVNGDVNPRFGMEWLGLITPVEFIFMLIGMYFVIRKKEKSALILYAIFLIAPIANSLSWMGSSLARTYPMILAIIPLVSYGVVSSYEQLVGLSRKRRLGICMSVCAIFAFYNYLNFDLYFNHYFQRANHIRVWQCGYKELVDEIKSNYSTTDRFYITRNNGQPYIYLLFFMQYDPLAYHNSAKLSPADEYGFTQVEGFDKFVFELPSGPDMPKNAMFVGFPDQFKDRNYNASRIKKIMYGSEEIFWIYKN